MLVRILILGWCVIATTVSASDAQAVSTFEQLSDAVKAGTVVFVADESGQVTRGKITQLSPVSIAILTSRDERTMRFDANRVRMVSRVDSKWNGFLIGAAAGAVPGAMLGVGFKTYCENESASCPGAPVYLGVVSGLIGGWIGAGIDGLINGQKVVYQR